MDVANKEVSNKSDRGSGSVLALSVLAGIAVVSSMLVAALGVLPASQRTANAADAAALAAADTLAGIASGSACDQADRAAVLGGATLITCDLDEAIAHVTVSLSWLGLPITAAARAGPPQIPTDGYGNSD